MMPKQQNTLAEKKFINKTSYKSTNMFKATNSIEISADLYLKLKKHCAAHGFKLNQFAEEAIIEKMISDQIKN
jgi:hypothetical protein